jgi:hypothetical protein
MIGMTYYREVMADSPVAYWRLGEASGTTAVDAIGSYNGTYVSSPTLGVEGAVVGNTAVTLGGSSYISLGDVLDMGTSDWTIEGWVKTTDSDFAVFSKSVTAAGNGRYGVYYTGGNLNALFDPPSGDVVLASWASTIPKNGSWHHIAATFNRDELMKLYCDGALRASTSISAYNGEDLQSNFLANIGAYQNALNTGVYELLNLVGSIDEVAIYNTALSPARIAAHYAAASVALRTGIRGNVAVRGKVLANTTIGDFVAATGATDTTVLANLTAYLKLQNLWDSVRFFPFKSAQNKGSGTTVYGLGGWTSNNIALVGGPTWGADGVAFDAVDDRGNWPAPGIESLSELWFFDIQKPSSDSLADVYGFAFNQVRNSPINYITANGISGATTGETNIAGINNARFGTDGITWLANAKTQIVTRFSQTGFGMWKSKAAATINKTSGTQDFRPSLAATTAQSLHLNATTTDNGSTYIGFTATTRVALLACKTSLTQAQRETITDYLDAL